MGRRRTRRNSDGRPAFDREAFFLGVGVGTACLATGALIGWATLTAPDGGHSATFALTLSQRVARLLPETVQTWIALVLAGLFVLFGLMTFVMGLWTAVTYVVARLKQPKPPPPIP